MATIHVLPLRMNLFQNLKCQTGNSFFFFFYSENFRRRMNNTNVLFIQKLPGVNVRDQEFHVKSIWLCRASKSEMSNWREVFSIHNYEDIRRRMNNKTFFFIEKSPSVNVREQKFHVKSIWCSR